ncbi:hypothetical protein ACIHCQ_04590 [Streptomyces sp. NPDC052236]|uniref:hypothetical protein n=1 Tax=Streptomyces sp. NPDC052236 TaxID=3365686 RepID=UPI0037D19501
MADERYEWLDKAAAEKLLSGEPVEITDEHARAQAARLSRLLYSAERAGYADHAGYADEQAAEGEMPGEAAALAAYRKARADADAPAADALRGVRVARPPRTGHRRLFGRPVRFGIAAAVAGCALGGVAIAAGTGFLPAPFDGDGGKPLPAPSVSGAATPGPLVSDTPTRGGVLPVAPPAPSDGTAQQDGDGKQAEAYGTSGADCREYRSGRMVPGHQQRLEAAAKGPGRVAGFCARALGDSQGTTGTTGAGEGADAQGAKSTPGPKPGKSTGAGKAKAEKPKPAKPKPAKPNPKPAKPGPAKPKPKPAKPAKPAKAAPDPGVTFLEPTAQ